MGKSIRAGFVVLALAVLLCMTGPAWSAPEKKAAKSEGEHPSFAPITEDPKLPRVLLIGDSISMGYTLQVRDLLKGKANVLRIPVNGGPTTTGVQSLGEWLGTGKWDVIHFNWGLHDTRRVLKVGVGNGEGWQVAPETYRKNLEMLVHRMKTTGAKLIWATTTPIPDGVEDFAKGEEVKANAIAADVMKANGVAVDDLYGHVLPQLEKYQHPHNVHFTYEGSTFLAKQVAGSILEALKAASAPAASKEAPKK